MAQIVNVNLLAQIGRPNTSGLNLNPTSIRFSQIVTATPLSFVFPQGAGTNFKFGIPQSVFVDNSKNTFEMDVSVQGTSYSFPVPALSTGYYNIDCIDGDTIQVTSAGISSDLVEIVFYNYTKAPIVWYKNQTTSTAVTIADGADTAEGSVADAAVVNPALNGTVIGLLKGLLTKLNTLVVGTAVTIADGADVAEGHTSDAAVTNPALSGTAIALQKGILQQLIDNAASTEVLIPNGNDFALGSTTDAAIINPATSGTVIAFLKGLVSVTSAGFNTILRTQVIRPSLQIGADSGNVANAVATATLAATASVTNYLTGVYISASGSTAGSVVTATITGLLGGTKSYTFVFPVGALVPAQPINIQFDAPMQASAANTAIVVTLPAGGLGNTNATVTIEGFRF